MHDSGAAPEQQGPGSEARHGPVKESGVDGLGQRVPRERGVLRVQLPLDVALWSHDGAGQQGLPQLLLVHSAPKKPEAGAAMGNPADGETDRQKKRGMRARPATGPGGHCSWPSPRHSLENLGDHLQVELGLVP